MGLANKKGMIMSARQVGFSSLDEATVEDFAIMHPLMAAEHAGLADRVLKNLELLKGSDLGLRVDRYVHSLQTATRAHADGADEETVVVALVHDIGDLLAPDNHGAFASEILRPFVSDENYFVARHHPLFQGYFYFDKVGKDRNARERFLGHPAFQATADFCEKWDCPAFDPQYESMPIAAFEPMVQRLFARTPREFD